MSAQQLATSRTGMVHIAAHVYTNPNGKLGVTGACNKMVFGPTLVSDARITCKNCAKRAK